MVKMKTTALIFTLLCCAATALQAQIYSLSDPNIRFFSSAPLEDIEAVNKSGQGLINTGDNSFSFRIPIKGFKFAKQLMQEHFNENYMESDKFPYGTFKGNIEGNYDLQKSGTYEVNAIGTLNIHGVEQQRTLPAKLVVDGDKISLESVFNVKLEDHSIEIPTLVFQNIAEVIEVTVKSGLVLYSK